jgi:hypothetical protein
MVVLFAGTIRPTFIATPGCLVFIGLSLRGATALRLPHE